MPAALPLMSSQRRRRVVMSRCSVPLRRSTMSAMPAVIRLNRMKLTIMPGELRTKPLGIWPAAAPASTTLVAAAGWASAAAHDRPGLRGRARDDAVLRRRPACSASTRRPRRPRVTRARRSPARRPASAPRWRRSRRRSSPAVETIVRSAFSPVATAAL